MLTSAFEVLRTAADASDEDIRRAFTKEALRTHPDKLGDEHAFKVVFGAYGVLKNPSTKAEHVAQMQPAMPGSPVLVHSLKKRSELNGLAGVTHTWDGLRIKLTPTMPGIGGVSSVQAFPGGGPGFIQAASDRNEAAFIVKLWNTTWGEYSDYCTACKRWADGGHVQCARHIAKCASPGVNGGNFAQASSSGDLGEEMRWNADWDMLFAYCLVCNKWCDDGHRASGRHMIRCSPPSVNLCWTKSCIKAAHELACKLSVLGESGFEACNHTAISKPSGSQAACDVREGMYLMRRLCLICDARFVPASLRKNASHCGGVAPRPDIGLIAWRETPEMADATNAVYNQVVQKLLARMTKDDEKHFSRDGLDRLRQLNAEHCGDMLEAALAAASVAFDLEVGRDLCWSTLCGGAHGCADNVTPFLQELVYEEFIHR
jgi:hypothetical protein